MAGALAPVRKVNVARSHGRNVTVSGLKNWTRVVRRTRYFSNTGWPAGTRIRIRILACAYDIPRWQVAQINKGCSSLWQAMWLSLTGERMRWSIYWSAQL